MKPHYILTIAMLAGVALGAIGVQALHAQTKPPVYYVAEVDVTDLDGYLKDYAPKAAASSSVPLRSRACPRSKSLFVRWSQEPSVLSKVRLGERCRAANSVGGSASNHASRTHKVGKMSRSID
jgi:hypothetical protein